MIHRLLRLAAAALVLVSMSAVLEIPRAQAYGSYDVFQTWTLKAGRTAYYGTGTFQGHPVKICTVTSVKVYVEKLGKHGVVQLKAKFELKSPQDNGRLLNYDDSGWFVSPLFPNDARNLYSIISLRPGYLTFISGGIYAIWVKTAAVRYGEPDYTRHFRLNEVHDCPDKPTRGGTIDFGR